MHSAKTIYESYVILCEKVDKEYDDFQNENNLFNGEMAKFVDRLKLWTDYHRERYNKKTITEIEAVHLADVMESSVIFFREEKIIIDKVTDVIKSVGAFYDNVSALHENKTPGQVLQVVPELNSLCQSELSGLGLKREELRMMKEDLMVQKKRVEAILNKYSN